MYDTSGPYTDPAVRIDVRSGLAALRAAWIEERQDTELLADLSSEYGRQRAADEKLDPLRFNLTRAPRRAKPGPMSARCITPAVASSPRNGICGDSGKPASP